MIHRIVLALVGAGALSVACASVEPSATDASELRSTNETEEVATEEVATLQLSDFPNQLRELARREVDIAGFSLDDGRVEVVMAGDRVDMLADEGIRVASRNRRPGAGRYKSPAQVETILQSYEARFPALAKRASLGRSHERR